MVNSAQRTPVLVSIISCTIYGGWTFGVVAVMLIVVAWKPVSRVHHPWISHNEYGANGIAPHLAKFDAF
jgi:hypothetical protein